MISEPSAGPHAVLQPPSAEPPGAAPGPPVRQRGQACHAGRPWSGPRQVRGGHPAGRGIRVQVYPWARVS
eukprot:scaffold356233_cov45-Prasinocladus_malaysianus.AAC.1